MNYLSTLQNVTTKQLTTITNIICSRGTTRFFKIKKTVGKLTLNTGLERKLFLKNLKKSVLRRNIRTTARLYISYMLKFMKVKTIEINVSIFIDKCLFMLVN